GLSAAQDRAHPCRTRTLRLCFRGRHPESTPRSGRTPGALGGAWAGAAQSAAHTLVAGGRGGASGVSSRQPRHRSGRSEEHTSELQSRENLVCRLLLEKKTKRIKE